MTAAAAAAGLAAALFMLSPAAQTLPRYEVAGDAIDKPLTDQPGDAARGREIVTNRQQGLCLLCHSGPFPQPQLQGSMAPSLAGAGARWSAGQLRLRLVDPRRLNPDTFMPSYLRSSEGLTRVGTAWQGKTVLTPQQVEDVVAFLRTLRD